MPGYIAVVREPQEDLLTYFSIQLYALKYKIDLWHLQHIHTYFVESFKCAGIPVVSTPLSAQ